MDEIPDPLFCPPWIRRAISYNPDVPIQEDVNPEYDGYLRVYDFPKNVLSFRFWIQQRGPYGVHLLRLTCCTHPGRTVTFGVVDEKALDEAVSLLLQNQYNPFGKLPNESSVPRH